MGTIKAIQQTSVHQIQSGQVIVDLNSVVKELVENSLDAGSTSIEVRFRNNGLDAVEVVDNGSGIAPEDFDSVALKHHTSKLKTYDDLESLDTFGFRGEALASLCALSAVHIITARDVDAPKGQKLEFETSGKLKNTTVVAAQRGTKVVIEKLFYNLPVRKKELEKNIKREYSKVLSLLQAYACISTRVRFVVSNHMSKGGKNVAFSTAINNNTKDNITNVFGAKTLHALVKLDLKLEMQQTEPPSNTQADAASKHVMVQGHISRPVFGQGRQAPDRQFFFVNSRPCALPQVAKAFNEVYRSFNVSQSPFIFANLVIDTHAYDVNVSPDKRTILLHDQNELLESIKAALVQLFEEQEQSVPQSKLNPVTQARLPSYKPLTIAPSEPENGTSPKSDNGISPEPETPRFNHNVAAPEAPSEEAASATHDSPDDMASHPSQRGPPERLIHNWMAKSTVDRHVIPTPKPKQPQPQTPRAAPVQNAFDRMRPSRTPAQIADITIGDTTTSTVIGTAASAFKQRRIHTPQRRAATSRLHAFAMAGSRMDIDGQEDDEDEDEDENEDGSEGEGSAATEEESDEEEHEEAERQAHSTQNGPVAASSGQTSNGDAAEDDMTPTDGPDQGIENTADDEDIYAQEFIVRRKEYPPPAPFIEESSDEDEDADEHNTHSAEDSSEPDEDYVDENERRSRDDVKLARLIREAEDVASRPSADKVRRANQAMRGTAGSRNSVLNLASALDASMDDIKQQAAILSELSLPFVSGKRTGLDVDNGLVTDDMDRADAEAQLSLTVSKPDFGRMAIAGQFNLGFIIALRPNEETANDDLFIIDQHAADEKFNFERFTRSLTLDPQRLAQPKQLYLTAIEEEIILHHSEALVANGFVIETDTSGASAVGERCKLVCLPMSKETTFDLSDLEELLHLLSDHSSSSSVQNIPRPSKVRKMLAMRACRSSIMVGKTLTQGQMEKVVRNLGEMDKPWNCPHGRPTMRHLAGLGSWQAWDGIVRYEKEEGGLGGGKSDWSSWLRKRKGGSE